MELYALPPDDFTSARNARAAAADRSLAARVKTLRKPTAAAWAVDLLARDGQLAEALELADALREAQDDLDGAELARLNPPYLAVPAGMVVFSADYKWLALAAVTVKGADVATECLARGTKAALLGQRPLTMGQSLAAGLRAGLLAAQVPVWLNTPLTDLHVEGGAVTGAVVTRDGAAGLVRARRGVVVGSGGFEHDAAIDRKSVV